MQWGRGYSCQIAMCTDFCRIQWAFERHRFIPSPDSGRTPDLPSPNHKHFQNSSWPGTAPWDAAAPDSIYLRTVGPREEKGEREEKGGREEASSFLTLHPLKLISLDGWNQTLPTLALGCFWKSFSELEEGTSNAPPFKVSYLTTDCTLYQHTAPTKLFLSKHYT